MKYQKHKAVQAAISVVCKEYNLTSEELTAKTRLQKIVLPRQITMWLVRQIQHGPSYAEIGRDLGGLNHSTVIYATRLIGNLRDVDKDLRKKTDAMRTDYILQIGQQVGEIEVHAEWITNKYIGGTRKAVEDLQLNLNAIRNHVRTDAVMEGWRKEKINKHLDSLQMKVSAFKKLPNYRAILYNQVKADLMQG